MRTVVTHELLWDAVAGEDISQKANRLRTRSGVQLRSFDVLGEVIDHEKVRLVVELQEVGGDFLPGMSRDRRREQRFRSILAMACACWT